jgi:hypothetical protein
VDLDLSDLGMQVTKAKAGLEQASILFYGPIGCGKTTIAATAVEVPELAPVLVLDFENSSASVAERYGEHPDLDVVQLGDWKKAEKLVDHLCKGGTVNGRRYKTVVVDPMNAFGRSLQQHMITLVEYKRVLLHKEAHGKLTAAESRQLQQMSSIKMQDNVNNSLGEATTSRPDYGMIGTKFSGIIDRLHRAPFLTIFVTHANREENEQGRSLSLRPDMPGNVAKAILGERPHLVGFVQKAVRKDEDGNEEVFVVTRFEVGRHEGLPFIAKKRLPVPQTMVNTTIPAIWEHINGGSK